MILGWIFQTKKKEHPWKDLIGLISRSLTFERNSTQSR